MEDHIEIKSLHQHVNKEIVCYYLVAEKELREGKQDFYLRLKLQDKTGSINANLWTNAQKESENFGEGDVVKIKAMVISYKGQTQLTIQKIRCADYSEYDIDLFLTRSQKDPDALSEQLFNFVDSIENQFLKKLLKSIFEDKEFFPKFVHAPAAKTWHHNFIHGLLEHTVAVAKVADFCAQQYPLNYDLLMTGALLHDIAKVYEYESKKAIDFTDIGRLIGHLSLGDQIICQKAALIDGFPDELLIIVRHLILSHHGEYEKASVRLPQTLEATVLHYCDNLDAQTVGVMQMLESASPDSKWTDLDRLNNRYYYIYRP